EVDAEAPGRLLRALLHVDEEGAVQGLEDERDARGLRRRVRLRRFCARSASRGQESRRHHHRQLPLRHGFPHLADGLSMESTSTAVMITTPITICWKNEDVPRRFSPLRSTPMMRAPIRVPCSVPTPPERLVPPMTVAAMASSS